MSEFLNHLANSDFMLADGAIGTNLFSKGLQTGDAPELWNSDNPEKIIELHSEFVAAGSDILLTNSFGGTAFRLKLHQAENRVKELNEKAVHLAKQAAEKADRPVFVAGSIGPTGELFTPLGMLEKDSAIAAFSEQAEALVNGGADCLWIETMSSHEEIEAATIAAKKTGLPVFATMTFDTAGRTMMGLKPAELAELAGKIGLNGFGANCGIGPSELLDSIFGLHEASPDAVLIAKGNCGIPAYVEGEIHYHGTPDLMADYALCAKAAGAKIIGGCCGTSPAHLAAMRQALDEAGDLPQISRDAAAARLGKPWASVPVASETRPQRGRGRRRRG